ncbi:response regulator [Spirosoma gilvum]
MVHESDWMLIVVDQMDLWLILQARLKQVFTQLSVICSPNGPAALDYLQACLAHRQRLPRLILTDLYLPQRVAGLELLGALKATSLYGQPPVIVMSSSMEPKNRQAVNQLGASYLDRPVSTEEWADFLFTLQYYWLKSDVRKDVDSERAIWD